MCFAQASIIRSIETLHAAGPWNVGPAELPPRLQDVQPAVAAFIEQTSPGNRLGFREVDAAAKPQPHPR